MNKVDLVIIGGGSAGLAAALGAYQAGIKDILILEKDQFLGGILNQCIHPGFGLDYFKQELTGPSYAQRFIEQIKELQIPYQLDSMVTAIGQDKQVTYFNAHQGKVTIQAKAIILATGCYERHSGAITLTGDRPNGIITAGLAQRYMNIEGYHIGQKIFILGSGDIGLIMARRLTLEGADVVGVAEIMPYSNGLNRNLVQCLQDYNIPLYLSHTVIKTIGKGRLEKVIIGQVDPSFKVIEGTEKTFEVDTLMLSVGLLPSNELLDKLDVAIGAHKGAIVDQNYETEIEGIFSCGNVLHVHDLVDFVTEEGLAAGKNAAIYIQNGKNRAKTLDISYGSDLFYILPNHLKITETSQKVTLKFRVKRPINNAFLVVRQDDQIIKRKFFPILIPSEMGRFEFEYQANSNQAPLHVTIEERK